LPSCLVTVEIHPSDAPPGAEVIGLDRSKPLSPDDFTRIHRVTWIIMCSCFVTSGSCNAPI
jgi:hypothetical protein